jgi:NAD(P)-dependent dehydrogenase (short-subunit alcohol dehydrogenase family)
MRLEGRVTIITGAASGIGRASAKEFAREGAKVVVADINLEGAQETAQQIVTAGGLALAIKTDVSQPQSVQTLIEQTLRTFGKLNVLFNNAAIQVNKTIEDTTIEEWNRQMAINLGGVFLCSKYSLPHLRDTTGCVINMASVDGFFCRAYVCGLLCHKRRDHRADQGHGD